MTGQSDWPAGRQADQLNPVALFLSAMCSLKGLAAGTSSQLNHVARLLVPTRLGTGQQI